MLDALQVLLVDGEPSTEPLGGETDFLAVAFSLGASDADAFRVEIATDSQADFLTAANPQLIVLANVASLTPAQAQCLQRLVASGVGLMIFAGEQIDPDNYNQVLFREGAGLLPAAIDSIEDQEVLGLTLEDETASPLAALGQLNPAVLSRIKIRKFLRLKLPATLPAGVRVLARWNDPAGSPAAIEKAVGRGRVLLWSVTADKAWSDWPKDPSYVLAMREAAKALVRSDAQTHNLVAGEAIRRQVSATHAISHAEAELPDAERPQPLAIEATEPGQADAGRSLVCADTRRAGLYKLQWQDAQAGAGTDLFAVNPDVRESALARIADDDLRKLWGAGRRSHPRRGGRGCAGRGRGTGNLAHFWRWVYWGCWCWRLAWPHGPGVSTEIARACWHFMTEFFHWLLGINESPDLIDGGSWAVRCQALPEGLRAVVLVACGCAAIWGVWWLYRLEGARSVRPRGGCSSACGWRLWPAWPECSSNWSW